MLIIRRRLYAINPIAAIWEDIDSEMVAWSYDNVSGTIYVDNKVPNGFVGGLLSCYVGDRRVTLQKFDEALKDNYLEWDRNDIMKALGL